MTEGNGSLQVNEVSAPELSPAARYDLVESVTLAFLLALEALTPAQRAVLLLREVFDYSTSETAKALEMTDINVKVTLHRARRIMNLYDKARWLSPRVLVICGKPRTISVAPRSRRCARAEANVGRRCGPCL